jgi:hypothetical protein
MIDTDHEAQQGRYFDERFEHPQASVDAVLHTEPPWDLIFERLDGPAPKQRAGGRDYAALGDALGRVLRWMCSVDPKRPDIARVGARALGLMQLLGVEPDIRPVEHRSLLRSARAHAGNMKRKNK